MTTEAIPPGALRKAAAPTRVLIIDDSPFCREIVSSGLKVAGMEVCEAADGAAGLEAVRSVAPDLILLDNEMPVMGGLEFLKNLRGSDRWAAIPVVMVTSANSKEVIMEAMRHKISGYMLKENLNMPDLLKRIGSAIKNAPASSTPASPTPMSSTLVKRPAANVGNTVAGISVPNLVSRQATIDTLADLNSARIFAGTAKQLAAININRPAATAEVCAVVRQDPLLATRIIQLASNSGTGKSKISSIEEAVRTVGAVVIQNLVSKSVANCGVSTSATPANVQLLRCWQHSLACAATMTRLVPRSDSIPPGMPYLIGLCHDVVELCLRQRYPLEFKAAQDYATQARVPTNDMLPAVFGIAFPELMQELFSLWNFPVMAADAIHDLFKADSVVAMDGLKNQLSRALWVAEMTSNALLLSTSADHLVTPLNLTACRNAQIPPDKFDTAEIESDAVTAVNKLAEPSAKTHALLVTPLIARSRAKVLYLRHSSFAAMDPLEIALGSLAEVEAHEKITGPEDFRGFNAVIVAVPDSQNLLYQFVARYIRQMKDPIPVLAFTASTAAAPAPPGSSLQKLPVPIPDLADFIGGLG
jgi:CheY-like chemotaxis protein/HD-like signal output (HDOD) protein